MVSQMIPTLVAKWLSMGENRDVREWIRREALPALSFSGNNGVRYFDREWWRKATNIFRTKERNVD